MKGPNNQENPLPQMSSASGGSGTINHNSRSAEDDSSRHFYISTEGNGSHWTYLPKPSHNYVEYLSESSTCLPKIANENMIESNHAPLGSINNVDGVNCSDSCRFFYNDQGKPCRFKTTNPSTGVKTRKQVEFWRPDENEVRVEAIDHESTQHLHAENHASWKAKSIGDKHNVSRVNPMVVVGSGTPSFLPKTGCSSSKQKSYATDRHRRQRMADNLKALHELLPNPAEGSQACIVDDIIDHVKYLQLQIKELTGSRLQAESTATPLVFQEGYGHYINQQMLNEPLEEMMGKLLEENSAEAGQLLESKGLFLLPIAMVEDLCQAIQMFGGSALV